jgi:hypothetical protein
MRIVLGNSGTRNVHLDLDILLRTRLLIQANSGGGKSWLLRRLAEQLFGKIPVIIIDPEGEFASLREKYGYVLLGQGGEASADPRYAAAFAEKFLEIKASVVCDLFESFRKNPQGRHTWTKNFCNGLLDAPKRFWHPTILIIDEFHKFVPEKGAGESEASEAVIGCGTAGRKRGICLIGATQRLSKVRKDVSAELLNRLVGPTFEDVDLDRAADLLSVLKHDKREFFAKMRILEPGMFYALGRAISKERILVKIGAIKTTHPEMGSGRFTPEPPPPPERVMALLPKLADLPKAAEEKARTEAELRQEIRSLKAQVRAHPQPAPGADVAHYEATKRNWKFSLDKIERLERQIKLLRQLGEDMFKILIEQQVRIEKAHAGTTEQLIRVKGEAATSAEVLQTYNRLLKQIKGRMTRVTIPGGDVTKETITVVPKSEQPLKPQTFFLNEQHELPRTPRQKQPHTLEPGQITPRQRAILAALVDFEAIGRTEVSRKWIAARAGASHRSSAYGNNLSYLRTHGYLEYGSEGLRLTDAGRAIVPSQAAPLDTEALLESCLKLLTPAMQRILKPLHAAHPASMSREELAAAAGASPTSSAYGNNLSALHTAGMIDYVPGGAKAADWLFVE